jgi:hypothetical protein
VQPGIIHVDLLLLLLLLLLVLGQLVQQHSRQYWGLLLCGRLLLTVLHCALHLLMCTLHMKGLLLLCERLLWLHENRMQCPDDTRLGLLWPCSRWIGLHPWNFQQLAWCGGCRCRNVLWPPLLLLLRLLLLQ